MKKGSGGWLVLLVVCLTSGVLHAAPQSVVLLQANESAPYWSEKLSDGGMGTEIVQAISQEMGMKTHIEFLPLKRIIADTKGNPLGDPLFYMSNQDFAAIIPIALSYTAFFSYHKNTKKISPPTLSTVKKIGILKGVQSDILALKQYGDFEESYTRESLFKKLKAGRLDLVLELDLVGLNTISTLFPNEANHFETQIVPESSAPIAIMIDNSYPDAIGIGLRYQQGLHRILKNGTYAKIVKKYYKSRPIPSGWYNDLSKYESLYAPTLARNSL